MKRIITTLAVFIIIAVLTPAFAAKEKDKIKLPEPQIDSGKLLMHALKDRHSTRSYSEKEIPEQVLANLLWAGFGVNRPDKGGRTAPSAMGVQDIDIYVAMEDGLYLYLAEEHSLLHVTSDDLRADTGNQPFVATAPLNFVYVSDYSKMERVGDHKEFYSGIHAGCITQNVYLYCASEGLATVVRAWVDKEKLHEKMGLRDDQHIVLAQTIGYPGE